MDARRSRPPAPAAIAEQKEFRNPRPGHIPTPPRPRPVRARPALPQELAATFGALAGARCWNGEPGLSNDVASALQTFRDALVSLPLSHLWRGYGSAIFLEFGRLTPSAGTRRDGAALDPRGEFGLMIQWSWRIENATSILCGSWSEEFLWGPTFDLLRNKVVQELSVVGRLPEIAIVLAGDLYVSSFMTAEGDPQWALFDRRGGALRTLSVSEGRLKLDTK